ncbi:ATP-binding /DNA transporter domain protein [Escherichia coli 2-222-05_S3_C2]|nr:hypothetical protein [Escherichia coli]EQZ27850.1 hypothetical protein G978_04751 [Escherichia coli UMEA 3592-1]EQZ32897.1 hypothetical protein G979_04944 [Escherichia coli UMEA 3609-1]KDX82814.1 ATP-binding /DNA transporter domain protein [Escherichia coli 2-222-05_S3_C3]KEN93508.1 ATP-binding /DNA transporter domain protein [Escherichia coli 2-222-05_S3_C2]KEO00136.1 ATP-binding /DNA transporter domain protein [Escherichia coli 2-222-05_S3_C1]
MSFNAKDMTQGGQIASMRIRMFSQIANISKRQRSTVLTLIYW